MQVDSVKRVFPKAACALTLVSILASGCGPKLPAESGAAAPDSKSVDVATVTAEAERGVASAQWNLGAIFAKGVNGTQSYSLAAKWYRLAADQGEPRAQLALGELHEVGQGVPRDPTEAANWFRKAAAQGNATAQYSLATLYVQGKGVPANDAEALKWYRLAAEQGEGLAQFTLGMRYAEGRGVDADPVQAYQWLNLAVAQGISDAGPAWSTIKSQLSREQLAEANRRVREFAPKTSPAKPR